MKKVIALGREAILMEIAIYRALCRWIIRRPDVPQDATAFGYSQLVGPMLWLWIFGSAVEVVVADVLANRYLPVIRIPLLVIGIWGLVWMIGLYAAYRVRPHVLTESALRLRGGIRATADVPLAAIASASMAEHELPGVVTNLHIEEDLLLLGVSSRTNLELQLVGPTVTSTSSGEVTVTRVGLWVDEPREVARVLAQLGGSIRRRPSKRARPRS